jgi:hypothetical protein
LTAWDDALETLGKLIAAKLEFQFGLMQQLLTGKSRLDGFESIWEWQKLAIPVFGPWLKRKAALAVLSKYKFVALPNMIADEAIQLELRGDVTPEWIANESLRLLESSEVRANIRSRLEATMPKPGAANRLAERVIERLERGAVTFNVSTASRSKA